MVTASFLIDRAFSTASAKGGAVETRIGIREWIAVANIFLSEPARSSIEYVHLRQG